MRLDLISTGCQAENGFAHSLVVLCFKAQNQHTRQLVTHLELPYTKHTLENGLDVVVHEDHNVPMVAVNLWYHVGSKNEQLGRTGFAHLFEHLMFEGSAHHNASYFQPLERAGASVNGSTNTDRTNYWEVVPSSAIELALWLESDRMGYLLPMLTEERFETQRGVVLNERRESYENRPYGMAMMALMASLYPQGHPYSWPTIGYTSDIRAARLDDVHAFFRTFYHPANASLAVAGDIDPARAHDLVHHYFGELPATGLPAPVRPMPTALDGDVRLVLEDRVELPRLYVAWHSPAMFAAGDAELDLVSDLLANGKTSRLYRTLVFERQIALEVGALQYSRELSSSFQLVATAVPGRSLADLLTPIDDAIDELARRGPTDEEMERSMARIEAAFLSRLRTVGGFGGKSDQLNTYNVFCGDPGFFSTDIDRYWQASADAVCSAAAQHLMTPHRVLLSVVPRDQTELALPHSERVEVL
jgi:zinc protease